MPCPFCCANARDAYASYLFCTPSNGVACFSPALDSFPRDEYDKEWIWKSDSKPFLASKLRAEAYKDLVNLADKPK